jgi:hypothetical protein
MNFIHFNSIFVHPLRFLLVAFVCTLLFFSSAFPVAAMGRSPSSPSKGEVNLNEIQRKTDETVSDPPITIEEIQKRSQGGINEVQGAADANKMNNPANSEQAPSVIDDVKEALTNLKQ